MENFVLLFLAGFSIGILGSLHCVGMCGPIALSLPVHSFSPFKKGTTIFLYNFGRAFSYSLMGAGFGLLGHSFTLFKLQQWLSILAGIFILFMLFFSVSEYIQIDFITKITSPLKIKLGELLKSEKKLSTFFFIGLLNGFLPCGLVYVAVATALSSGGILSSAFILFSFGLGTMPLMILTILFGKYITYSLRNKFSKIAPMLIAILALLLIVRGLNLGVPYLSPKHDPQHRGCCHAN